MRKIRIAAIDDDPMVRKIIGALVAQHNSLTMVGEAPDAASGMELIEAEKPDAIFLDIFMPGQTGFDLLSNLVTPPKVVIVTSSLDYALQAFEVDAVDYLVKPLKTDRFATTVHRLKNHFFSGYSSTERYEKGDRICLRVDGKTHVVALSRLIALSAQGNFTKVQCTDELTLVVGRSIGEFSEILPLAYFTRLDRSTIINSERITRVDRQSRDLSKLWLRGLSAPLELGRTATHRLREIFSQTTERES